MSSKEKLLKLFQEKDKDFDVEKLTVSKPFASAEGEGKYNTSVVIKPKVGMINYLGSKTISYNRANLENLFYGITPRLDFSNIETKEQCIVAINNKFGLDFDISDFKVELLGSTVGARIEATDENYEYFGQVTFIAATDLDKILEINLEGFSGPEALPSDKIQGVLYGLNLGLLNYNIFKTITDDASIVKDTLLQRILNEVASEDWVNVQSLANYNTYGLKVVEINDTDFETEIDRFITLEFDDAYNGNFGKYLMLHTRIVKARLSETCMKIFDGKLRGYDSYLRLNETTASTINEILETQGVKDRVTKDHTIVYNGPVENLPSVYLPYVSQNTTDLCIIMNGFDKDSVPMVLSYN